MRDKKKEVVCYSIYYTISHRNEGKQKPKVLVEVYSVWYKLKIINKITKSNSIQAYTFDSDKTLCALYKVNYLLMCSLKVTNQREWLM